MRTGGQQHLRKAADVDGVLRRERLRRRHGARAASAARRCSRPRRAGGPRAPTRRAPSASRRRERTTRLDAFDEISRKSPAPPRSAASGLSARVTLQPQSRSIRSPCSKPGDATAARPGAPRARHRRNRSCCVPEATTTFSASAPHAARAVRVGGERAPQLRPRRAGRRARLSRPERLSAARTQRPHASASAASASIEPLRKSNRGGSSSASRRARDLSAARAPRATKQAALRHALGAPLDDEPRVCVLDRRTAHAQLRRKLAHRRQPRARGERPALSRIRERAGKSAPTREFGIFIELYKIGDHRSTPNLSF